MREFHRAANWCAEDAILLTWRPPWGPTTFSPIAARSMIDRDVRAAIQCAEGTSYTELLIDVPETKTYRPRGHRGDLPGSLLWRQETTKQILRRVAAAKPLAM